MQDKYILIPPSEHVGSDVSGHNQTKPKTVSVAGLLAPVAATCAWAIIASLAPAEVRADTLPQTQAQCPRGHAILDGCANAPANGSFILSTPFGPYARQSGQKWVNDHPWPWNAPGVDYPVGYSRNVTLQDPATASLPVGCAFQTTGSPGHGPRVFCDRKPDHTGVVSPTIQYIDFSLHGCTVLEFSSFVTGTITVANNNFKNGPNCAVAKGYLIKTNQGSANLFLEYNQIDGDAVHFPAPLVSTIEDNSTTGYLTMIYNAIVNSSQRPASTSTSGNIVDKYNYIAAWNLYNQVLEHGEIILQQPSAHAAVNSVVHAFNTTVIPAAEVANSTTATFALSGTPGAFTNYGTSTVDHNVVVTNLSGGVAGAHTTSAALAYVNWGMFGVLNITNNYVDPTGAISCTQNVGGAQKVVGGISGNTVRVTSVGAGAVYAGAVFQTRNSLPSRTVLMPYGTIDPMTGQPTTGRGGPGTYVLSGAPQVITFTAGATETSPVGHVNVGGNYSLVTGAPIIGVGSTFNGATCPPLY